MNLLEKIGWYYRTYGVRALIVRGVQTVMGVKPDYQGRPELRFTNRAKATSGAPVLERGASTPIAAVVDARFPAIMPLPVFSTLGPVRRLNLVTDSISAGSLFGGVGTAIILAALLAKQRGAVLRVVTRSQEPDQSGFRDVLACNGIPFDGNVEFEHVPANGKDRLDICDGDTFLTTSWWTTQCVLGSIAPHRVEYLIQEDERMFYPLGDDWLRCNEVMERRDLRFIVNTELLKQHFLATGLEHFQENSIAFEPAFPESMFHSDADGGPERAHVDGPRRRKLFFYARPNNLRNTFYRGIEALDRAVLDGVLDTDAWEVVFVGKDVPAVRFSTGAEPTQLQTMNWSQYGAFIRSVDLGFCLMMTPHPSYPPLDLVASGATVVTNRFGLKQDLARYSDSILMADLTIEGLVEGLRRGIERVESGAVQAPDARIQRSWLAAFQPVLDRLG